MQQRYQVEYAWRLFLICFLQRHAALSAISSGQPLPDEGAGTGRKSQLQPPLQRTVPVGTIKVISPLEQINTNNANGHVLYLHQNHFDDS
jgi:hypothetical protein